MGSENKSRKRANVQVQQTKLTKEVSDIRDKQQQLNPRRCGSSKQDHDRKITKNYKRLVDKIECWLKWKLLRIKLPWPSLRIDKSKNELNFVDVSRLVLMDFLIKY